MPEMTNGKKRTINVNQIIYKELHRPQVIDTVEGKEEAFPIYTKVDSYKGSMQDTRAEKSPKYQAHAKTHFNSANNIRRLFITHNKIYIDYYTSPGAKGKNIQNNVQATLSEDLLDILPKIASFQSDVMAYQMEKNINPKAVGPDQYVLEGNLFGVINQMYTCSNIEEIYFDWTYMFASTMRQYISQTEIGAMVGNNGIQTFMSGQLGGKFTQSQIWLDIFKVAALHSDEQARVQRDPNKFRDKYPRIRVIAMINNLEDVINGSRRPRDMKDEIKQGGSKTWLEINFESLKQQGSFIVASKIGNIPNINTNFVTQENTYLFDRDFTAWVKTYKMLAEDIARQKKYGTADGQSQGTESDAPEADMNEVELRLILIEKEVGPEKFREILKVTATSGFKDTELRSIFRSITKGNRLRWAKEIGLSLD